MKFPFPKGSSQKFTSNLSAINQLKPIFEFISEEMLIEIDNQLENNEKIHPVHRTLKLKLDSSISTYERSKDYFQFYAINYSGSITSPQNVKHKLEWFIPRRIDVGYARIKLNYDTDTNNTYLEEELSVPIDTHDTCDKYYNYHENIKVRSPIVFVNSTWAQYLAGHTVSARYTMDGLAKLKIEMETQLESYLSKLLDNVLRHQGSEKYLKFNFEVKVAQKIPNYKIKFSEYILFMKSNGPWELSINISAIPIK